MATNLTPAEAREWDTVYRMCLGSGYDPIDGNHCPTCKQAVALLSNSKLANHCQPGDSSRHGLVPERETIMVTVTYRCQHTATQSTYPDVAERLVESVKSWLCRDCLRKAPERCYGRGRGSAAVPFIGRLYA